MSYVVSNYFIITDLIPQLRFVVFLAKLARKAEAP